MLTKFKLYLFNILLLVSLITFSNEICVLGGNCPLDQGMCVGEYCKCLDGFYSLLKPGSLPDQQIYCNYEQINVYIPLIMELLIPSSGHFYAGKYYLGSIKLFLMVFFLVACFAYKRSIVIPEIVKNIASKNNISINTFIPQNNDEKLRSKASNMKIEEVEQAHNEDKNDVYSPNLEEKFLIHKEENQGENEEKEEENKTLEILYQISLIFWVFYCVDIFLYKFKIYNDGNDVPFIE